MSFYPLILFEPVDQGLFLQTLTLVALSFLQQEVNMRGGTGQKDYQELIVGSQEEYDNLVASKESFNKPAELQENE